MSSSELTLKSMFIIGTSPQSRYHPEDPIIPKLICRFIKSLKSPVIWTEDQSSWLPISSSTDRETAEDRDSRCNTTKVKMEVRKRHACWGPRLKEPLVLKREEVSEKIKTEQRRVKLEPRGSEEEQPPHSKIDFSKRAHGASVTNTEGHNRNDSVTSLSSQSVTLRWLFLITVRGYWFTVPHIQCQLSKWRAMNPYTFQFCLTNLQIKSN